MLDRPISFTLSSTMYRLPEATRRAASGAIFIHHFPNLPLRGCLYQATYIWIRFLRSPLQPSPTRRQKTKRALHTLLRLGISCPQLFQVAPIRDLLLHPALASVYNCCVRSSLQLAHRLHRRILLNGHCMPSGGLQLLRVQITSLWLGPRCLLFLPLLLLLERRKRRVPLLLPRALLPLSQLQLLRHSPLLRAGGSANLRQCSIVAVC